MSGCICCLLVRKRCRIRSDLVDLSIDLQISVINSTSGLPSSNLVSLAVSDEDYFNREGSHLFAAANEEQTLPKVDKNGRVLQLSGQILGSVKDLVRPFNFSSFGDRTSIEKADSQMEEIRKHYVECQEFMNSYQVRQKDLSPPDMPVAQSDLQFGSQR